MSTYLGNQLLSGVATNTISNAHSLFDFIWSDHIKNEMSWLRADTFSWQSGDVYVAAYNHLVADWDNYWTGKDPTVPSDWENETIGSYLITYITAPDGHKIVYPNQETIVQNIYNESGVAWYYILDKDNHRFKLPRTKYGFTGLRDTIGKYVEPALPNISGTFETGVYNGSQGLSGCFKNTSGTTDNRSNYASATSNKIVMDASDSSPIYKNLATVQPPATQMYLYFYVGEYSQSQAEQVATLDVQMFLNKADIDLNNLSASGQAIIDGKANTNLSNLSSAGQALFTAKLDADKIQQVSTLPASPVAGTLYLIPE